MILFEESSTPAVRNGEFEVASRRIAARAFPYAGEVGAPRFRFDPVERRFLARTPEGTVLVGPHDPDHWRTALVRGLAGPVLVGPGSPGEEIRGAYRAAAEGARLSGRAVYLLDPDPRGLPDPPGRPFTALFSWFPGLPDGVESLAAAREKGIAAGWILPLVAGWTASPEFISEAARRAAAAGAEFLAGVALHDDGLARRIALEAAAATSPESADALFEEIHHGGSPGQVREALERLRQECAREGIAGVPPRPVGSREPASNAAAAARLEEMAGKAAGDEHRAALIHAAARWLDESGRDLAPIAREGNLSKVFPFGADLARDVQEALLAAAR
jgi:hypothetical protein